MSAFPHQYTQVDHQGAADNAIPESLMSSRVPKAIPTLNRIVSIPSASGSASQSGTLNWVIPGGSNANGFLRAGSLYLRATITATKAAGGNADNYVCFANQVNSAASLINRLQITANGTMLETINRYDNYHAILLSHAMNANYVNNDSSITEYATSGVQSGIATTAAFNIALPLCSAVFSNQKSWPLFLSGLNVQIDLNPATALKSYGTGATAVASYSVSNAELVYELIQPDYSLLDTIRAQMAQTGKMFEMPMSTALGLTTAIAATSASFAYNVGLNLASVSAVLLGEIVTATETATTGATQTAVTNSFVRNCSESSANSRRFYLDGKQMVNYDVWSDSQNFNETQRSLSVLLDPANTTIATRTNYCAAGETAGQYYIVGQSGRRFQNRMSVWLEPHVKILLYN